MDTLKQIQDDYVPLSDEESQLPTLSINVSLETNPTNLSPPQPPPESRKRSVSSNAATDQNALQEHLLSVDPDLIAAKAKNSIELLVQKEAEKDRKRIKGKYFGRHLILIPFENLTHHNTMDAIREHTVQKIMNISEEPEAKSKEEIWSKIKSIKVEHVFLKYKNIDTCSEYDIAQATEPFAQCLMNVIEYIMDSNAKCKKDQDAIFEFAGIQHKAHQSIVEVIKNNFELKSEEKKVVKYFVKEERERLEFYMRNPNKKRHKLLVVYENPSNAAFIAIGYRMVVYRESLQRAYSLFRHCMKFIPRLSKLHVYVLQSLDYVRFGTVSVSMDLVCYHNITKSLVDNGFLESNYD